MPQYSGAGEALRARNPRLVYAAVRGFGDPRTGRSPYADWPAFDIERRPARPRTAPEDRVHYTQLKCVTVKL